LSDTLDKQVKIELLINAIEAMKSIDGVADKLAKVKSAYSTPTGNNGGFGEVAAGVEQVGKAADETKEKFKTFQRQLSELKLEAQKAFRGEEATRGLNEISKEIMSVSKDFLSFRKSISDVSASSEKGFWEKVVRGLPETSAAFKEAEVNIKSLAREIDRIKEISKKPVVEKPVKIVKPKELDELTTLRNMLRDLENQKIRYNDTKNPYMAEQVQKQIDQLNGLRKAVQDTSKETEKLNTKGNVFDTYKKSISEAEIKAQQFFRIWKQTGDLNAKRNFEDIVPVIEKLNRESVEFYKKVGINSGRGFYDLGHSLDYFMAKFRSHMNWIATGMVLDSVLTLPDQMLEAMKKIEVGMAGMIQTLPQLHGNQKAVNDLTREFLGLSAQYGEKIENTIEAAKLWSRAYKTKPQLCRYFIVRQS
jgi:hypothetical protein